MAQSAVVTILGLEQKSGTGKNGKPYTISKVKASDGNTYDTFEIPLYQAAVQAGQAPVVLEYETRLNGEYTNYDLKGVSLANGHAPAPVVEVPQVAVPVATASPSPVEASTYAQDKDARITRLSAASTAFDYAAGTGLSPEDALGLANDIEHFANNGYAKTVAKYVPTEAPQPAAATTPSVPWENDAA